MPDEREALHEEAHVFVEVIGVELVDDGVDVDRGLRGAQVLQRANRQIEAAAHAGDEVLEPLAARVDAHVEVGEARGHVLVGEARLGELGAVGDHAHVQAPRDGVAGDVGDQGRQRRLAARQDDAEVAALGEVVDGAPGRVEIEHPAGGGVGAEPAVLVAVADQLQVSDVRHG